MGYRNKKRALIAGGAGFIGSFLCERFLENGWEVICLDSLFTGDRNNILHLFSNPRFEFVRHDVVNPYYAEVDLVMNFACPASPIHYQHNPIKTTKVSFLGTLNLLGLAKRVNARYVQASTSEVYGDPEMHPQKEEYWGNVNPLGIRACYDEGKRVAETLCMDYLRKHHVDVRIIRIFNTYGPRMACDDGRVVSNFIVQALRGEPITIYGNGSQSRSFCFIDDLVEGIWRFTDQNSEHGPLNLGNETEFTVAELARKVIELTGAKSEIKFLDLPQDDPKIRRPDLTKARSLLKWEPKIPLEEGLKRTIPYFAKVLKEAR